MDATLGLTPRGVIAKRPLAPILSEADQRVKHDRPQRARQAMSQHATASRPAKTPGPDHPIAIEPNPNRVTASAAGHVIGDPRHALTLREATYPPVTYIPRKDVD